MAIYCRESLHKYLVNNTADKVFNTTDRVMQFYEEFFGFPYPFSKYDHIFCPECNFKIFFLFYYVFKDFKFFLCLKNKSQSWRYK